MKSDKKYEDPNILLSMAHIVRCGAEKSNIELIKIMYYYELTRVQSVLLTYFVSLSHTSRIYLTDMADAMGMSYMRLLSFMPDIEMLERKRFIESVSDERICYKMNRSAMSAILINSRYSNYARVEYPSSAAFLYAISDVLDKFEDGRLFGSTIETYFYEAISYTGSSQLLAYFSDKDVRLDEIVMILYISVRLYMYRESEVNFDEMLGVLDREMASRCRKRYIEGKKCILKDDNLVEEVVHEGEKGSRYLKLTRHAKETLFSDIDILKGI